MTSRQRAVGAGLGIAAAVVAGLLLAGRPCAVAPPAPVPGPEERPSLAPPGGRRVNPVEPGLAWLARHQDEDGRWDCDGFMKHDGAAPVCDGGGSPHHDPGVTGLALLSFLGAGQTHRRGGHRETVAHGLAYLRRIQDAEGCFGPRTDARFVYDHALAALAMVEAFAWGKSPVHGRSAQRAVDFIEACRNPSAAWRYGVRPGESDTSVSGWMAMALLSAKDAGLRVDEASLAGVRSWLDRVTDPGTGRVGYTSRDDGPDRPPEARERWPAGRSESLTALGVLLRIRLGEDPRRSGIVMKGTGRLRGCLPRWEEATGAVDMCYWLFGTGAAFHFGGDVWKEWNAALRPAIADHQRTAPPAFAGSWDPVDPWGSEGGRVASTAFMVLCLDVFWHATRVFYTGR